MNWRQIERWATIAIYISAGVSLAILLVEERAPPGSPAARLAQAYAGYLTRMGEIGGGTLFAVVLAYLTVIGVTWIMVLLIEGIDRLRNWRVRSEQRRQRMLEEVDEEFRAKVREEVREEVDEGFRAKIREEVRAEMRADIDDIVRKRLAQHGAAPDTPPREDATAAIEPPPTNIAPTGVLTEESLRRIVHELMQQIAANPSIAPRPERQETPSPANAVLNEEIIRNIVSECLRQLGIKPGQSPATLADE